MHYIKKILIEVCPTALSQANLFSLFKSIVGVSSPEPGESVYGDELMQK